MDDKQKQYTPNEDDLEMTEQEYGRFLKATEKSYNVTQDAMQDVGSGMWDPEMKAHMDLWTLKSLFFNEDWVFIGVDRIASKLAPLPLLVMKDIVKDGKVIKEPAADHPFQKRIDNPNEFESYYQWMYNIVADYCITGNAIVWNAQASQQLVKIPTELVQLFFNQDTRELVEYHVSRFSMEDVAILESKMQFAKGEIVHIRRPNPSSSFWGLSPFIPGKKSVLFNRYSTEYLNNFYVKGAQPGMIFQMADNVNEKSALRMLRSFELAHTGRKNQRRNMVLPKGVTSSTSEHKITDQQLQPTMMYNRETIINLLQLPKEELSITTTGGGIGSDQFKTALKNFWGGPLKSIMMSIEWAFYMRFRQELGTGYSLQFDTSGVEILREDETEKARQAEGLLKTHTLNQVRQKVYNDPPLVGGDKLPGEVPPPMFGGGQQFAAPVVETTAPIPELLEAPKAVVASEPPIQDVQGGPEIDKMALLGRNMEKINQVKADNPQWWDRREVIGQKEHDRKQPEMVDMVMDLFGNQAESVLKIMKNYVFEKAVEVPTKARLKKAIKDALNSYEASWLDDYTKVLKATVDVGYDMSLELPFNMPNQSEISALRDRNERGRLSILEERGIETFSNINQTSTDKIMREITNGVETNLTIQQIAKNIQQLMTDEDFTIGRAMTIARTEVLTASSIGQAASMADAAEVVPDLKKMWLNAGDSRVRGNPGGKYPDSSADHWTLQGEVRKWDENFSNGLHLPRDTKGEIGETINCRCTIIMVPGEDAAKLGLEDLNSEVE